MVDVARWLVEQGLGHHAEAFAENGIAGGILREFSGADLKELGLDLEPALGAAAKDAM